MFTAHLPSHFRGGVFEGRGNVFTLKELLGHTSLHISNRYVTLAQADIENQHRQFSPTDRLKF
jgi:integrase/recombinase XerD